MSPSLSTTLIGRLAGLLFMGCGLFTAGYLFLPGLPLVNRTAVLVVCLVAVGVGVGARLAPWHRWSRSASLWLIPVAFALIASGNYWGAMGHPYTFGIFFVVAFAWVGMGHRQWTALKFAPVGAVAYVVPLLLRPTAVPGAAWSAALTIPVSVLVAEGLAWIAAREARSREQAQALARIASALGAHLSEAGVFKTLVDETRVSMGSQHVVLCRLDASRTVFEVFSSGVGEEMSRGLAGLRGVKLTYIPQLDVLSDGRPIVVDRIEDADAGTRRLGDLFEVRSFMAVPIRVQDVLVGVLVCADSSRSVAYGSYRLALAQAIAAQAAAAIQNAILYQQTLEASLRDHLTGLGNRRAFQERLEEEVSRARRYGRTLSLVLLDLDDFKQVNDGWGHQAGDRVLTRLAEHLRRNLRRSDSAYRVGGDEFAVLLPETPAAAAARLTDRIRRSVSLATLEGGAQVRLSFSCGLGSFPDHGTSPDELFARADASMYAVKDGGGDAVAVSTVAHPDGPALLFGLDVQRVIRHRLLHPLFQPIVELSTRRVFGYESFCHIDPSAGLAPTPTLFRAADAQGLLPELDRLCRSVSLDAAGNLPSECRLFLNICPAVLDDPSFSVRELRTAAATAGLEPERVVIDVTEPQRRPDSATLARNIRRCIREGFEVALDDVRSEADLELLARVGFNYAKVDMALVDEASSDSGCRRLLDDLKVLVDRGATRAIVEGVETDEDLRSAESQGFWAAQGFLLGAPASEMGSLVGSDTRTNV